MTKQEQILNDPNYLPLHEYGFVGLVDVMGDDSTPAQRARISYGTGTKSVNDDRNLLRYLVRHRHTTPLEMVELVFHLKMPIFVMRQHVRHRMASINEYSGRYSEMSDEFYVPDQDHIGTQSTTNKQGTNSGFLEGNHAQIAMEYNIANESAYRVYRSLLDIHNMSRELSRCVLPVSNYTELYWKINLHNFFHYLKLRTDKHAQFEIREYATAMLKLVEKRLPIAIEACTDYILQAHTFSRMEMQLVDKFFSREEFLKAISGQEDFYREQHGMSKREWDEFKSKLNIPKE